MHLAMCILFHMDLTDSIQNEELVTSQQPDRLSSNMFYLWDLFQCENEFSCILRSVRVIQQ